MRIGFSGKELAQILGVHKNNIKASIDPAMEKLAKLWMKNPTKTMDFLLDTVHTLQRLRRSDLPMSEEEIGERISMLAGRYDGPSGPECGQHTLGETM